MPNEVQKSIIIGNMLDNIESITTLMRKASEVLFYVQLMKPATGFFCFNIMIS